MEANYQFKMRADPWVAGENYTSSGARVSATKGGFSTERVLALGAGAILGLVGAHFWLSRRKR